MVKGQQMKNPEIWLTLIVGILISAIIIMCTISEPPKPQTYKPGERGLEIVITAYIKEVCGEHSENTPFFYNCD